MPSATTINALCQIKFRKIYVIFGGSNQVDELTHFRLISRLVEEFEEVNIIALLSEISFDEMVDRRLEHERIVDSDESNFRVLVPAWLPSASDGSVHDIVGNEEESLQLGDGKKGRSIQDTMRRNPRVLHTSQGLRPSDIRPRSRLRP